jgi:hypothetical protein
MYDKFSNKTAPRAPRCLSCAQPMQLLRRTSRFGELPDLYSFYCRTCDEWHIEEDGTAANALPDSGAAATSMAEHRSMN